MHRRLRFFWVVLTSLLLAGSPLAIGAGRGQPAAAKRGDRFDDPVAHFVVGILHVVLDQRHEDIEQLVLLEAKDLAAQPVLGDLDVNGAPLTSEGKITERFRRPNLGTLEIDVTIDDPKSYTKPWTVRVNQRLLPDTELIEFVCLENNQFNPNTGSRRPR